MSKNYVTEMELIVLDVIGVGSLVLVSSVKSYILRNVAMSNEVFDISRKYDLSIGVCELVDLAEQSLFDKGLIIRSGKKIKQPCAITAR